MNSLKASRPGSASALDFSDTSEILRQFLRLYQLVMRLARVKLRAAPAGPAISADVQPFLRRDGAVRI